MAQRMMDRQRRDALIASAWNLHAGMHGDEPMTPRRAATLPQEQRANLCVWLAENGGCDIYSRADAIESYGMEAS